MKIGIRKPSIKRSIKARTTGKLKRSVKRAVNPLYEKKGMGYINDPKKAVYNKVYNKTTVGVRDIVENNSTPSNNEHKNQPTVDYPYSAKTYKGSGVFLIVIACILAFVGLFALPTGLLFIGVGVLLFFMGKKYINLSNHIESVQEDEETDED